jgi:hypothetical protein
MMRHDIRWGLTHSLRLALWLSLLAVIGDAIGGGKGLTRLHVPVGRVLMVYLIGAVAGGTLLGLLRGRLAHGGGAIVAVTLALWPTFHGFAYVIRAAQGKELEVLDWCVSIGLAASFALAGVWTHRREQRETGEED